MFKPLYVVLGLAVSGLCVAGNPVITERFSADPAALVHDGVVYLYAGHDEAQADGDFFVLREWSIYSSENLQDWVLEGSLPRTAFAWARGDSAWASQAIEHEGKFYWYVTVLNDDPDPARRGYALGVAVSDHPVHGWQDAIGGPLVTSDMTEAPDFMGTEQTWDNIDPTVFVDDDGQAYLYWGNTHLYYARLHENMIELDSEIYQVEINNIPGTFTEAPWLHKYGGQYYLSFAMNYPEQLAYAVSDSPQGPWEYQGLIMDVLTDSGTSHQAILEYEGDSYLIYHTAALPTGGNYRRSVSIEHLRYNDDGSIQKITPTASGIHYSARQLQVYSEQKFLTYQGEDGQDGGKIFTANQEDAYSQKWHLKSLQDTENTVSFQPDARPGFYLVADDGGLTVRKHDGSDDFIVSATFERVAGLSDDSWHSYRQISDSGSYLMLQEGILILGRPDSAEEREAATFKLSSQCPIGKG